MQMHPESNMRSMPGEDYPRELYAQAAPSGTSVGLPAELQHRTGETANLPGLQDGHGLYREAFERFHRKFVLDALKANDCNQVKTAAAIGIHRNTLNRWILDLDIWPQQMRKMRGNRHA